MAFLIFIGFLSLASMSLAAENTWTRKADMPTARLACGISAVDGKIYVIGGFVNSVAGIPTVEAYDPETDTWEAKANMPAPRCVLSAATVNGKIYAIGGARNSAVTTVEEYDPARDVWTKKASIPTARNWLATAVVNEKIYAIGGWNGSTKSAVEEYDPETDTWTRKASMPSRRWGLSVGVANGKIYAIGGVIGWNPLLATVEEYDPVTDTWTRKSDMPKPRAWIANYSPTVDGRIYVMGGWSEHFGAGLPTLTVYDPVTDTWTEREDMPEGSGALMSAEENGKIYAIGGWNGRPLSNVEEYDTGFALPKSVKAEGKLAITWGRVKSN
jgi:N-acetylneuraminic acid mutarotase